MKKLNLKLNKRPWKTIHRFEEKVKALYLKKLTTRQSFSIFCELYQIAIPSCSQRDFNKFSKEHVKHLARIHAIFNRVKA